MKVETRRTHAGPRTNPKDEAAGVGGGEPKGNRLLSGVETVDLLKQRPC